MGGKLIYMAIASLDGYIADASGRFDWSMPDAEVHAFVNDWQRPIGTYLLGRRMYDVLKVWDSFGTPDQPDVIRDYAGIWANADKIVYSRRLKATETKRTRMEPSFAPEAVRRLKAEASRDFLIGGAELAGEALAAGLVDDVHLLLSPILVGGGTRALPDGVRIDLSLESERRFANGVVHLHYRVSRGGP